MNNEFTDLIQEYLTDGIISPKERKVLLKKAKELGIDVDEAGLYIEAQQQKANQKTGTMTSQSSVKACPFCGELVPMLTSKCPSCKERITHEAYLELQNILDNLEEALAALKSRRDIAKSRVKAENYIRTAKEYYSKNTKVMNLVDKIARETAAVERKLKRQKILAKIYKLIVCIISICIVAVIIFISRPTAKNNAQKCIEATNKALELGNIGEAEAICSTYLTKKFHDSKDIEVAGVAVVNAYLASEDIDKAAEVCDIFELKEQARDIVKAYITVGEIDKAADVCAVHDLKEQALDVGKTYISVGEIDKAADVCAVHYLNKLAPDVVKAYIRVGEIDKAADVCAVHHLNKLAPDVVKAYIRVGKIDKAADVCAVHHLKEQARDVVKAYIRVGKIDKAADVCAVHDLKEQAPDVAKAYITVKEIDKAAKVCVTYNLSDQAMVVAESFLRLGRVYDAEVLCHSMGILPVGTRMAAPIVYEIQNGYISCGKYDEAEKCIIYNDNLKYYEFLCKCIKNMLETGSDDKSIKLFIKAKIQYYPKLTLDIDQMKWIQSRVEKSLYKYAGIS